MKQVLILVFVWIGLAAVAGTPDIDGMAGADVVILGEVHDNPAHHRMQSAIVAQLNPAALVFEMLSGEQAARVSDDNRRDQEALAAVLGWDQTGWPDFAMYFPIFRAAGNARIYGAGLTRTAAREALETGITGYFGDDASRYGLDRPLDADEQAEREEFQRIAHCGALPDPMLAMMVDVQRLRDATLARVVVTALKDTGGVVVVITGNGHARKDRGLAVYLDRASPDLTVYALGQSEEGQIDGVFDRVLDYPAVEREDPCLAFEKQG